MLKKSLYLLCFLLFGFLYIKGAKAQEVFGPTCDATICPTSTTAAQPTTPPPVAGSTEATFALLGISSASIIIGGSIFYFSSKS